MPGGTATVTAGSSVVPVFFLSDSTGISAETMGDALLLQFPGLHFERTLIPFTATEADARAAVAVLDEAVRGPVRPLAFTTTALAPICEILHTSACPLIDFFDLHLSRVEQLLGTSGVRRPLRLHGVGDVRRYNARTQAVEYAIEHDDGGSLRALDKADVVLLAPSRCGKTPTTMHLALQHGVLVANYPLLTEDLETTDLPRPVRDLGSRCFGITTTPLRLSQVRAERRPGSRYSTREQCSWELSRAGRLYAAHGLPVLDSSTTSVEEMSTVVLQHLARRPS
ncbi:pyruvate, water dikinase regulatory protein [Kineococcus rhizosphaerae]|uniref:Uncharacterized protein n=1 Tax=Kineococcus rhizosphaerae TaxID=559628 RepID=A0A2T0R0Z1_9ACTN|nr:kinase/pyrophosphorylase [Kineococcus rhizosphaerae]PRY12992.1 hypothetical protein CLV37_109180 [Kineococcus rhizosphaerae]